MKTLTVRNIPDEVHAALRVRAAKAGHSMEEEVRQALVKLAEAETSESLEARVARAQARVRAMFGGKPPRDAVDRFIAERRQAAERGE